MTFTKTFLCRARWSGGGRTHRGASAVIDI